VSPRGPACSDLLVAAGVMRVVGAIEDPDPRTAGAGFARLRSAGIAVDAGTGAAGARRTMAGFLTRRTLDRPFVTLKLATSLDGMIATASGQSRWITGPEARAHVHLERSRHETILVGRGTQDADAPKLDVRLRGLEDRSPRRFILSAATTGDSVIAAPDAIGDLPGDHLFVEGGAATAAAFLRHDLVDRLLLYRAPILIGGGRPAVTDIGLSDLGDAHGRWRLYDARALGSDRLEVYERAR
jgi:diaminohydroxyphosphoribosylaminopyrimidine deaminase/5-amino-6-(5-phosphoribosylamino)uracil reductase